MKKTLPLVLQILIFILSAVALYFVALQGVALFGGSDNTDAVIFAVFLGMFVASFLVTFVHELGHLIFGLLSGMAFYSMRVLFFVFYKQGGKLKIRFTKISSEQTGACEMVPKSADKLYSRFTLMVLGGGIFTALYLAASFIGYFNADKLNLAFYSLAAGGVPVSLYMLLTNSLPFSEKGMRTDGAVIAGLLRKDSSTQASIILLAIQSKYFMGYTPSEIDFGLYESIPELEDDDLINIVLLNNKYIYYLDKKDYENALKISDKLYELSGDLIESLKLNILSDTLYDLCRFKKDFEKADEIFEKVKVFLMAESTASNLRIRAAYSFYRKRDYSDARQLINRALDESQKSAIKGIGIFERKLLEEMKEELLAEIEKTDAEKRQKHLNETRIFRPSSKPLGGE